MKSLISLTTIFLLVSQCSVLAQDVNGNLIDSTCKQTPYYELCVSSLKSDSRSASADVLGLARIMVDIVAAKATDVQNHIRGLLKGTTDPKVQQPLSECVKLYDAVLKADIPEAIEALTKGDYKFAEQGANDAANEADSCEKKFTSSPITDMNKNMHDLSTVAASIVRILLST